MSSLLQRLDPRSHGLLALICAAQAALLVLPFIKGEAAPVIAALVLISTVALLGSVTLAVLYLCVVCAVLPTKLFDDHLLLPLDFKFYEGLFVVVGGLAAVSWLGQRHLAWRNRTRLDRSVCLLLSNSRTINRTAIRCDVSDPQSYNVTPPELTVYR